MKCGRNEKVAYRSLNKAKFHCTIVWFIFDSKHFVKKEVAIHSCLWLLIAFDIKQKVVLSAYEVIFLVVDNIHITTRSETIMEVTPMQ